MAMADETTVGEPKKPDWPARLRSEVLAKMADETTVSAPAQADPTDPHQSQTDWRATLRAQVDKLDARARELVTEGNRSRLVVQRGDRQIASLPLTAVAALGAVGLVVAPLGVVAALAGAALARVNARIER